MRSLEKNLEVELCSLNNNKISQGVIAHIEKSLVYVEIDSPEIPEEKLCADMHIFLKVGDNEGLKIYDAIVKYRLGGLVHLNDVVLNSHVQRRNDVKVAIDYEAIITCTSKDPEEMVSVHFVDLSAGGTCFQVNTPNKAFDAGDEFEMIFDLGDTPFFVKMRVLRGFQDNKGNTKYGCQFFDLSPQEEKHIREHVYKVQLTSRRNVTYQV